MFKAYPEQQINKLANHSHRIHVWYIYILTFTISSSQMSVNISLIMDPVGLNYDLKSTPRNMKSKSAAETQEPNPARRTVSDSQLR